MYSFRFRQSGTAKDRVGSVQLRYAIISDIHANLEALTTVLDKIETLEVDRTVCLGDLVGYNASPNEVVDIIREREIPALMGNHDAVACGLEPPWNFNPIAREAALWTRSSLTEENRLFLHALPTERSLDDRFVMVHGSLQHRDQYIFSQDVVEANFELLKLRHRPMNIAFFGHTHYQITFEKRPGGMAGLLERVISLLPDRFYLINPGSVGQPRDQDPRTAFAVYDDQACRAEIMRLDYDIDTCHRRILDAGLPAALAERLRSGV